MVTESKSKTASPSVEIFLHGLFDYAGLFPPAALTMPEAVREYALHRLEPDNWMTGPFVCPVSRLEKLIAEKDSFGQIAPIRLSLLPKAVSDSSRFEETFRADVDLIERLQQNHPDTFLVKMMEIRVPPDTVDVDADSRSFDRWLTNITDELKRIDGAPEQIFLEVSRTGTHISPGNDYINALERAARSVSASRSATRDVGLKIHVGFKIRCGGVQQTDYPSSLEIARFLIVIISGNHFFKATAGLHHPVRHYNEDAGATMHGFLNVFFAAVFFSELNLSIAELVTVLDTEDPSRFEFVDEGIQFDDYFVSTDALQRIRTSRALSIGSCSFDEPREDLLSLGWLVAD